MLSASQPIGVFDSGVGGLTVVRALLGKLPHEEIVYLGDTARVPYGSRSPQTVTRYSLNAARFLLGRGVKMVVVACNTASAAALPQLEEALDVPVLGAVGPGAQAAAARSRRRVIGVIGTLGTVRSGAYERALRAIDNDLKVVSAACPLFVPLVEEGWTDASDEVAEGVARRYLTPLLGEAPDLDTLVLGCTHYPLLLPLLSRVTASLWGREVALVDSASAMAEATAHMLGRAGLLRTDGDRPREEPDQGDGPRRRATDRLRCYVTDEARVAEVGARFLGRALQRVELVDL